VAQAGHRDGNLPAAAVEDLRIGANAHKLLYCARFERARRSRRAWPVEESPSTAEQDAG